MPGKLGVMHPDMPFGILEMSWCWGQSGSQEMLHGEMSWGAGKSPNSLPWFGGGRGSKSQIWAMGSGLWQVVSGRSMGDGRWWAEPSSKYLAYIF